VIGVGADVDDGVARLVAAGRVVELVTPACAHADAEPQSTSTGGGSVRPT